MSNPGMPRKGRPTRVIDPTRPFASFADALVGLRRDAGLTGRELARRTTYSEAVISTATDGLHLPSQEVTAAYVRACGGSSADVEEWLRKRLDPTAASYPDPVSHPTADRPIEVPPSPRPGPGPRPPEFPETAATVSGIDSGFIRGIVHNESVSVRPWGAPEGYQRPFSPSPAMPSDYERQLVEQLNELRRVSGNPSLRALEFMSARYSETPVVLSRSTLSATLRGTTFPSWESVRLFVLCCERNRGSRHIRSESPHAEMDRFRKLHAAAEAFRARSGRASSGGRSAAKAHRAPNPATLAFLRERAVQDQHEDVRAASVQAIAEGWAQDPTTLEFLQERALQDQHEDVRAASVQAIAEGWAQNPATMEFLQERAITDVHKNVRRVALLAITGVAAPNDV
jgi:hypothetical protein